MVLLFKVLCNLMENRLCLKCNKRDWTDFSKCRYCRTPYVSQSEQDKDEKIAKITRIAFWPIVIIVIAVLWLNRGIVSNNVDSAVAHRPKPAEDALIEFAGATDGDPRTKQALKEMKVYIEDSEAKGHEPAKEELDKFMRSKGY